MTRPTILLQAPATAPRRAAGIQVKTGVRSGKGLRDGAITDSEYMPWGVDIKGQTK